MATHAGVALELGISRYICLCRFIYQSIYLYLYLSICINLFDLSISIYLIDDLITLFYWHKYLFIYLSIYLSIYFYLSIYLSIYLYIRILGRQVVEPRCCPPDGGYPHLPIYLSIYLSVF